MASEILSAAAFQKEPTSVPCHHKMVTLLYSGASRLMTLRARTAVGRTAKGRQ